MTVNGIDHGTAEEWMGTLLSPVLMGGFPHRTAHIVAIVPMQSCNKRGYTAFNYEVLEHVDVNPYGRVDFVILVPGGATS